ncbi:hypothetical protein Tco_0739861 [Tanacetum coccineum]
MGAGGPIKYSSFPASALTVDFGFNLTLAFPLFSTLFYSVLDDDLPTALSPGYVADSDPKEDPKEDPADYPADGGDNDDESSEDDADDEDEKEASEEEEDDDEEEEEHLAPADSSDVPAVDLVPSARDTEAFEIDESAPTPPSPRPRRARIFVRPQTPMSAATETLIVAVAAELPSSPPPSLLTPLSSLLP